MKKMATYIIFFLGCVHFSSAQNSRLNTHHLIGWYNYFGTFQVAPRWSIHTEYQFRRNELVREWQQGLLRVGLNFQPNPQMLLRMGYAWIETYPYGAYPINAMGKDFTEHRTYQMVSLNDQISLVEISHRFMLEQRWVGRYSNPDLEREDDYSLLHRMRYMLRTQIPIHAWEMKNQTPYLALYDEIFIGFGKQVNENIFDQNRVGILMGFPCRSFLRLEIGYLNQIVQLSREVDNRNVFQYNQGVILNANFRFNLQADNTN